MKRYIRLKKGIIIDTEKYPVKKRDDFKKGYYSYLKGKLNYLFNKKEDVITESDNVLDLIQVGDLVRKTEYGDDSFYFMQNKEARDIFVECYRIGTLDYSITELYTKQGDNFILAWDKERGVI